MRILCDIDGVIGDWVKQVCNVFNVDYDKLIAEWPLGHHGIDKVLGMTEAQMWTEIDKVPNFWEDIPLYDYSHDLVNAVIKHEGYICTSPSSNPHCAAGKLKWMKKHFKFGRNFVITPAKTFISKS